MKKKLTLTMEKKVIEKAKRYAKKKNHSLSDIVENYFKLLTLEERKQNEETLSPIVKSLKSSFKASKKMDYKKELEKRLNEKHL